MAVARDFTDYLAAHAARRREAADTLVARVAAATAQARAAARRLGERVGVRRVILFGSLATGRFHPQSDIDLGVEGLPEGALVAALCAAAEGTDFGVDIVPLERAPDHIRTAALAQGVVLWPL